MTPRLIGSCCCSQVPAHFLDHMEVYIDTWSVGINNYYEPKLKVRFKIDNERYPEAEAVFKIDETVHTRYLLNTDWPRGFEFDLYREEGVIRENFGKIKYDNVVLDERPPYQGAPPFIYASSGRLSLTLDKDFEHDYWWLQGPTWHLVAPAGTYVAPNAGNNSSFTKIEGDIVY